MRVVVGLGFRGPRRIAERRDRAFAGIAVHPGHRRAGVGSALWGAVAEHRRAIGARMVVAHGSGDDATRSFGASRGFALVAADTTSAVDPRDLPPPPDPPRALPFSH